MFDRDRKEIEKERFLESEVKFSKKGEQLMDTEITKTNGATMKGKFVKTKLTDDELDAQVNKILLENKIDQLGWF